MDDLGAEVDEPAADFVDRIARAALRGTRERPRLFAYWAITWVADALDAGTVSSRELRDAPLDHVWVRLGRADVDQLSDRLQMHRRGSSGRRWLRYNRDRLAERYAR